MTLAPGTRLGPYEILGSLGAGGMGEVYRARDPRLERDVAIKVLPRTVPSPGTPTDSDAERARETAERLARFAQEARTIAALSHPNLLAIFDVGVGDAPYLVTELLDGETLRARLERGALPAADAVGLMLQITAGLAAAHARGIVHRDLKPDNIYVTAEGRAKILDFGLATTSVTSLPGDDDMTAARTLPGVLVGTLGYLSPEQARGQQVDHRSDLFACGTVLFEMLTGRRAFRGDSPADTLALILQRGPSDLSFPAAVSPGLSAIVRRCLDPDKDRRFQSARDLSHALETVSHEGAGPLARPSGAPAASVAVLPFANLGGGVEDQYFSDGLAEDIVNALARMSELRVASRTSSFRYRGQDLDVRHIGRDLGVGAVLEGSVRRAGPRLRLTVHLTSVADGYHIWSERYDRELADVFDVQDEMVRAIAAAITPALASAAAGGVRRATGNLQAYDLYLKGRHLWNQRSPAVIQTAIGCFESAIALDPGFAAAHAGLADCYSILRVYGWMPADRVQPPARDAVNRALTLDPGLAEAHRAKGIYTFHFERQWRSADSAFRTALALDPLDSICDATYGNFLATAYRYDDAHRHLTLALERDPHSAPVHFLVASAACAMGDSAAALRHAARAMELQPDALGPRWPQTIALLIEQRHDEALAVADLVMARSRAPIFVGVHAMVLGRAGRRDDAQALGEELYARTRAGEYVSPTALLALALGLDDAALIQGCLAACADGGAAPFGVAATTRWLLEPRRSDPVVDRLLDRLNDGAHPSTAGAPGGAGLATGQPRNSR